MERPGATTLRGNPLPAGAGVEGRRQRRRISTPWTTAEAGESGGTGKGVRIFSVVPSLDTPVCDAQTKRFNEEAAKLPGVEHLHLQHGSALCAEALVRRLRRGPSQDAVGSPRPGRSASNYGTLIKDLRIQSRAIFVLDKDDTISTWSM